MQKFALRAARRKIEKKKNRAIHVEKSRKRKRVISRGNYFANQGRKYFSRKMPSNIEIKAKMSIDLELASAIALELSKSQSLTTLLQEDTFFNCPNGRLKLRREIQDDAETAMLIAYDRPDVVGPKCSDYVKTMVPDPDSMEDALKRALGVKEKVSKKRFFTIMERDGLKSRIHLDNVNGLGHFIEFEVMIDNKNAIAKGEVLARFLSDAFHIKDEDLIDGAYVDIILEKQELAADN